MGILLNGMCCLTDILERVFPFLSMSGTCNILSLSHAIILFPVLLLIRYENCLSIVCQIGAHCNVNYVEVTSNATLK